MILVNSLAQPPGFRCPRVPVVMLLVNNSLILRTQTDPCCVPTTTGRPLVVRRRFGGRVDLRSERELRELTNASGPRLNR